MDKLSKTDKKAFKETAKEVQLQVKIYINECVMFEDIDRLQRFVDVFGMLTSNELVKKIREAGLYPKISELAIEAGNALAERSKQ